MSNITDFKTIIVAIAIFLVSSIIGITIYSINDRVLMAKNIDNAIAKGMDPLAVRCAYASSHDMVCVAYGASHPSNKK